MALSAAFGMNGGLPGFKVSVPAFGHVTAELDSTDGVRNTEWFIASTDDTTSPSSFTLVLSGPVNNIVDFDVFGPGSAGILKARATDGVNRAIATAKFYVPCAGNGLEVGAAAEEYESDPVFGATGLLNKAIRLIGGGGGGGGGGAPTSGDKYLTPLATVGDNAPTGIFLSLTPLGDRYTTIRVDRECYFIGDGIKTLDCYWSDDGGATAKALAAIGAGDELYWNGTIAGHNLSVTDHIDLDYDVGTGAPATILTVPNIAALSAINELILDDGTMAAMLSVRDLWQLDKTSVLPIDGINVVPTLSGAGRWLRLGLSSELWQWQSTWYIDNAVGNDENDGSIPGSPIRTWNEFRRRVGKEVKAGTVNVFIIGTLNEDVLVDMYAPGLYLYGERTVIYAGMVTSAQAYNPAGPTDGQITDAGLPVGWGPSGLVDHLCVLKTGPNAGACGWIGVDLGAKTARYAPFFDIGTFTWCEPGLGDTFDIVQHSVLNGDFAVTAPGTLVFVQDIELPGSGPLGNGIWVDAGNCFAIWCNITGYSCQCAGSGQLDLAGCRVSSPGGVGATAGGAFVEACLIAGTYSYAAYGGILDVYQPSLAQGPGNCSFRSASASTIRVPPGSWIAMYDTASGGALDCASGGTVELYGPFWGQFNILNFGVQCDSGGTVMYVLPAGGITVQGAMVTDINVGGLLMPYAGLPQHNLNNGAKVVDAQGI